MSIIHFRGEEEMNIPVGPAMRDVPVSAMTLHPEGQSPKDVPESWMSSS